ncbi:glycoside hydrolase family 3 N-terminal domain-containing protein [Erythrobacter litoralis]|uniref:glycoside hydrolase family 3 N-terminal domain-containing protein n=1 Tax=Erythrobacter litoralis TaxID=39960 RepID=UPI002434FF0E|nr:glycoside hydrolase family 3 N-terminal domain-containing protein [Erythrobacter litoralis]
MPRALRSAECDRLVTDLLNHMTVEEKAGQLGVHHLNEPADRSSGDALVRQLKNGRVGMIRGIASSEQADALQKVAIERSRLGIPLLFADDTGTGFQTVLPTHFASACSWDMAAIEQAERVVASEAAMRGINWALSPEILFTDTAGPDGSHSFGDDIHLAAEIAAARVRGLQGNGILASLDLSGIMPRHAPNGSRTATDALAIAQRAIETAGLGVIAFDKLTGHARTAMDNAFAFLRGPGGFSGIILSEWERLLGSADGSVGGTGFEDISVDALIAAVQTGRIVKSRLDDAVARILRAKFALGLFGSALGIQSRLGDRRLSTPAHNREAALTLAKRSMVLIRNSPALLPLDVDSGDILVVGTAAADRREALDGKAGVAASVIDGLEQLGIPHKYAAGLALREEGTKYEGLVEADKIAIAMASEAAKRSRTVILVLGDSDRPGQIGAAQMALLQSLRRANDRLILVSTGGLPVDPVVGDAPLDCILHAGRLGSMSGHAIAEVLTGESGPSGKLPIAVRGAGGEIALPFGHGLTYGDFDVSNIRIEMSGRTADATVTLTNRGRFDGTETVQLYLARSDERGRAGVPRLAGFQRVSLRTGERQDVTFAIAAAAIGRHLTDGRFSVEPGYFEVGIGLSSTAMLNTHLIVTPDVARGMAGLSPTVAPFRRRA